MVRVLYWDSNMSPCLQTPHRALYHEPETNKGAPGGWEGQEVNVVIRSQEDL